jgi:hypothetical protein
MERRYQKVVADIKALRAAGATPRVDLDRSVLEETGVITPTPRQGTGAPSPTTVPSDDPLGIRKPK